MTRVATIGSKGAINRTTTPMAAIEMGVNLDISLKISPNGTVINISFMGYAANSIRLMMINARETAMQMIDNRATYLFKILSSDSDDLIVI